MHPSVMQWVEQQVKALRLTHRPTLEVGSLDVNGTARRYFQGRYVGVDMQDGPGVDIVCNAHDLIVCFPEARFDVIVCTEMLEHDDQPWNSVTQMHEVAAPGAALLLTARGYDARGCFPLHGYPDDLWRFSCAGMTALLRWAGWDAQEVRPDPEAPGVFALAYA